MIALSIFSFSIISYLFISLIVYLVKPFYSLIHWKETVVGTYRYTKIDKDIISLEPCDEYYYLWIRGDYAHKITTNNLWKAKYNAYLILRSYNV